MPQTSPTWRYLRNAAEKEDLFPVSVRRNPVWSLPLEGREERVRRSLNTGTLAKHAAVFALKGGVQVAHVRAPETAAVPWQDFFIQHIYRWCVRPEPGCFVARPARDLCRGLVEDASLRAHVVFTAICSGGRPAAFHLGFLYGKTFYWHIPSFDIAFKRFCSDDVLWREVVLFALDQGCREVVCTGSEEPVVRRFAERSGSVRSVRILRRRRDQGLAMTARLAGKIPFARRAVRLALEGGVFLHVLLHRKKIVKEARRSMEGVASFQELYARGVTPQTVTVIAKPEAELLRRLRPELGEIRMLDIGVGAGRTSIYFASRVRSYTAIDYAAPAAAMARTQLDDHLDPHHILEADAKSMGFAADGMYDLVLFAGEGVDEAVNEDRVRVFQEIQRVGREGALFFFSSRNLQSLTLGPARGMLDMLIRLRRRLLLAAANPGLRRLECQPSALLFEEHGGYRLPVYYGTPREQVRVLRELGFHDVRVFSMRTGLEVRDWRRWDKLTDDSLYYLCRI